MILFLRVLFWSTRYDIQSTFKIHLSKAASCFQDSEDILWLLVSIEPNHWSCASSLFSLQPLIAMPLFKLARFQWIRNILATGTWHKSRSLPITLSCLARSLSLGQQIPLGIPAEHCVGLVSIFYWVVFFFQKKGKSGKHPWVQDDVTRLYLDIPKTKPEIQIVEN